MTGPPKGDWHVIDVRFLPNPHSNAGLRALDGRDERVRTWLIQRAASQMKAILDDAKTRDQDIAFGCLGGRHRSVVMAEELAKRVEGATVTHTALGE